MGKESFKIMPNINIAPVFEVDSSVAGEKSEIVDYSRVDFEKVIEEYGRRICIPGKKIFNNDPTLKSDPIEAIKDVRVAKDKMILEQVKDPVIDMVVFGAKLEVARKELKLNPKQKENFMGLEENVKGALGFFQGMGEGIRDKVARTKLFKVFLAATEIGIMVTACENLPIDLQPTEIVPNISPTVEMATATDVPEVIEVKPTESIPVSPTETQNPDIYKVEDGKIKESVEGTWKEVQIPVEIGEITSVELHEGKMYGIDTVDRAVVVKSDSGEWIKFERPIFGGDFENYYSEPGARARITLNEKVDLSEVPADEILRLKNQDGSFVDWGYIPGTYSWKKLGIPETEAMPVDDKAYSADFSGYLLGVISADLTFASSDFSKKTPIYLYVLEIPQKFQRQMLVTIHDPEFARYSYGVNLTDKYKTEVEDKTLNGEDLYSLLNNNQINLRGVQIIFPLKFTPTYSISYGGYDQSQDVLLWNYIVKDEGFDYKLPLLGFMPNGEFWINDSSVQ